MDKLSVHHTKKQSKGKKKQQQPIKVVYISNPMKVKTSPSDFRALVQELTGQDSNIEDMGDLSGYSGVSSVGEGGVGGGGSGGGEVQKCGGEVDPYGEAIRSLDSTFGELEPFDHDQGLGYGSCVFENFNGLYGFDKLYDFSKTMEKP